MSGHGITHQWNDRTHAFSISPCGLLPRVSAWVVAVAQRIVTVVCGVDSRQRYRQHACASNTHTHIHTHVTDCSIWTSKCKCGARHKRVGDRTAAKLETPFCVPRWTVHRTKSGFFMSTLYVRGIQRCCDPLVRLSVCITPLANKKLSYRRGTARCVVSIEILPIATQQCRNYLYDKS